MQIAPLIVRFYALAAYAFDVLRETPAKNQKAFHAKSGRPPEGWVMGVEPTTT